MNRLFIAVCSSLTALPALAQHEGAEHAADAAHTAAAGGHVEAPVEAIQGLQEGLATGITALAVFALVFVVLAVKVWPTITKALAERADKIKSEIEAAEAARQQAKAALEQYQKSLADARAEAQKMLDQTKAQQQSLANDLKAKADLELNAMRERAKRDIESAKKAALNEIYSHSVNLASAMAGKILRRDITPADHSRLVEESLSELASKN